MNGMKLAAAFFLLPTLILSGQEIQSISPLEAAEMARTPGCHIVDVRSLAEYHLIGHPVDAVSLPLTFWNERNRSFEPNGSFVEDLRERFNTADKLIFICRSGGRSLKAAEEAFGAGFTKVYSVREGFEGEKDEKGYRTVGGWRNRGLPYTYDINPNLSYRFR